MNSPFRAVRTACLLLFFGVSASTNLTESTTETMGKGRGQGLFFGASLLAMVCAVLRYVLLARLLDPVQLGLAATLMLVQQALEAFTDAGADRFIVQDAKGDEPGTATAAQTVSVLRGALIALCLLGAGVFMLRWSDVPELGIPLMVLSLSPMLMGFLHLDVKRLQRRGDFRPEGVAIIVSEIGSLAAIVAGLIVIGDFRAVLGGLIVRSLLLTAVSQITAERPFGLGADRAHLRRLWQFAWPLIANGFVLFLGVQGDRMLIGAQIGLEALGVYSAAILLIFYPTQVLRKFMTTTKLPVLSGAEADDRRRAYDLYGGESLLLSAGMVLGFTLVGGTAMRILYGEAYALPVATLALIAVLQALRYLRVWPVVAALALGRSRTVLVGNLWRMIGVPVAILAGLSGWGLEGIVLGFAGGEVLAYLVVSRALHDPLGIPFKDDLIRLGLLLLVGWAAFLFAHVAAAPSLASLFSAGGVVVLTIALVVVHEGATIGTRWDQGFHLIRRRMRHPVRGV